MDYTVDTAAWAACLMGLVALVLLLVALDLGHPDDGDGPPGG